MPASKFWPLNIKVIWTQTFLIKGLDAYGKPVEEVLHLNTGDTPGITKQQFRRIEIIEIK